MEKTTDYQIKTNLQTNPGAIWQVKTGQRLSYLDNLRVILTVLVVMVHAAVTYHSLGGWMYQDPMRDETTAILLSILVINCQSFFMGLFFFVAGYFTPGSVDRKGVPQFWKDRLLRLAIPLVAFTLILSKLPIYWNKVANEGLKLSFTQFFSQFFWTEVDAGPTWFLFVLLIFAAGYGLWRLAASRFMPQNVSANSQRLPVPGTKAILGFALVLAAVLFATCQVNPLAESQTIFNSITFVVSFMPQYILMFVAGILAYRNDWLSRLPGKTLKLWAWMALSLIIFLPVFTILGGATSGGLNYFFSGLYWQCLVMNLWVGLMTVSVSLALILWLRDRKQPQSRLMKIAGANAFTIYLIHPLVLVPITIALSYSTIHPLVKFGAASALTVIACFALATLLRRLPGAKAIL